MDGDGRQPTQVISKTLLTLRCELFSPNVFACRLNKHKPRQRFRKTDRRNIQSQLVQYCRCTIDSATAICLCANLCIPAMADELLTQIPCLASGLAPLCLATNAKLGTLGRGQSRLLTHPETIRRGFCEKIRRDIRTRTSAGVGSDGNYGKSRFELQRQRRQSTLEQLLHYRWKR